LKNWDYYARENSIATTLAVEWAYQLDPIIQKVYTNQGEQDQVENTIQFAKTATSDQLIPQLQRVISELRLKFGTWEIEWGTINRFQRPNGDINLQYDAAESLPVAFGPAIWEVYNTKQLSKR
jgi:hypothetical protein